MEYFVRNETKQQINDNDKMICLLRQYDENNEIALLNLCSLNILSLQ